ncbi:MAG: hypothetical protein HC877_14490 [Thioploca sp.]|nr:hypothetical protein [Thioploca sp.]
MINPSYYNEYDYINSLVATPKNYSCLEAGRVQPLKANAAAHDAITRRLPRKEPNSEDLWQEAKGLVEMSNGWLELDDTTRDKPDTNKMERVGWHWSGKPQKSVRSINRLT